MKKRVLSLFIAIAMMFSLLPSFTIANALTEDVTELTYIFNQVAGGATGKNALGAVTYDTITQGNKWQYASYYKMASQALDAGGLRFVPTTALSDLGKNGMAIKLDVPEGVSGTFMPTITCAGIESGGILNVYLVSAEDASAKGWDMHTSSSSYKTSAVYQAISNGNADNGVVTKLIEGIDTYNGDVAQAKADADYSATVIKSGTPVELSTGTYYLVLGGAGANASAKVYSDTVNSYYYRITELSFKKQGDARVDVVSAKSEVAVGASTTVTASVFDGYGDSVNADVSFSSSNDNIATVDASGKVTGVAEGKATITASATVGGATVSGTVDINVYSTSAKDEDYYFCYQALGLTGNLGMSDNESKKDTYTYDDIDTSTSSGKWDYLMVRNVLAGTFRSGYASIAVKEANMNLNSVVSVKIKVTGASTYVPSFTYSPYQSGAKVNVYLLSEEARAAKGWDMSGKTSGLASFLAGVASGDSDIKLLGTSDTYSTATSAKANVTETDTYAPVELSGGDYYLLFVMNGKNDNAVAVENNNGPHYYFWAKNFKLTQMGDITVDATAAESALAIGATTTVSAKVEAAGAAIADATVTYKSSDDSIATVDANGKVTAIAEGKVTITATATVAGSIATDTVEIEVFSTEPRDEHYYFCYQALGLTGNLGMSVNESAKDAYTYADITSTSPSKWDYLMARNLLAGAFRSGVMSIAIKDGYKTLDSAVAFKIKVNGSGTYIPSIAYCPYQSGAKFNAYLLDTATAEAKNWDMTGKSTGLANFVSAVNSGDESITLLGSGDTYSTATSTNSNTYETDTYAPVKLSGGEYYLVFVMNGTNENAIPIENNNGPHYYMYIKNLKLTQLGDVSLDIAAESSVIELGDETSVSASVRDASGADVKGIEVSYTSSDTGVATVDANGKVVAKAIGTATITATATVAGVALSDSVVIEVEAEDLGNAGVDLEYIFSTSVMSAEARAAALEAGKADKNLGLDSSGNLRYMSFISKLSDIDATKSAQYAWVETSSYGPQGFVLQSSSMAVTATRGFYADSRRQFLAFKVNIPNKGDYNFAVRANGADFGAGADVHLIPVKETSEITRDLLDAREPVGHFETKGSGDLGYMKVGKFTAEKRGDYYVVFDFITDNEVTYQSKGKQYFYGTAMRITAASGDFDKVEVSLRGIEEDDPIAVKSVRDINVILKDAAGTQLDEVDESKLSVEITSDNTDVAVITEDGKLDAVACGVAKITVKVVYDGVERETTRDILVTPIGKELLGAEQNPDIESDVWPWDMARQDETPSSAWWIRAKVGTVEKDGDADNRAMGVVINPEIAASDVYGYNANSGKYNNPPGPAYIRAADGPRVEVKTGQFYLFTFKMKLENWETPSGAEPMAINLDLYPYSAKGASSSTAGYNRGMNITLEEGWTEKYKEWQTVTVPVSAEFLTGRDVEYFTPVFVFRPAQTDLMKAGYGGTAWFDDFSLREVGFDDLEVTIDGETALGSNSALTINVKPRTATGQYISLDASCVPKCLTIETDNAYILGEIMKAERTALAGMPGVYIATAATTLGGMNGTANISATMTLNGVTRNGIGTVNASNFVRKIMYANAEAEAVAVGEGNTTQVEVEAFDTNGEAIDLSSAQILYKSQSKDILTVDENGVVTPLASGTGYVHVTVIYENVTVVTTAEVHVTDGTPIVSAELTGSSELGYLRDLPLTIRGTSESGYAADIDAADIKWFVSSDAVSVNEEGYMYGNTKGETVEIYAEVTLNGATVVTNTITVTVVESDLRGFKIDFAAPKTSVAEEVTLEKDGWEFDYANTSTQTRPGLNNIGFQTQNNAAGQFITIKFNAPYTGYYMPVFRGRCIGQKAADDVDFYIDGTYIGNYSFYFKGMTAWGETKTMRTIYIEAGTHELKLRTNPNTQLTTAYYMGPREMYFIARNELPQITGVPADVITLEAGKSANINAVMMTEDNFTYAWQPQYDGTADKMASVVYASDNDAVATVDANGNIKAVSVGEATISVTAKTENSEKTQQYTVTVIEAISAEENAAIASAEIDYETLIMSINSDGIELSAIAKNSLGAILSLDNATVVWSSSDESVATVDGGKVTPVSEGIADITVSITIGDDTESATVTVSVRSGKTARTYYTDERVDAARENIQKYSWAKSTKDAAVKKADRYVELGHEYLWKMIPGDSIPRTWQVGLAGDPEMYLCRYCGYDVQVEYGVYPWRTNTIANPWKIQCPTCQRVFPSNNFAKLYELGIDDATGVYNVELAHERNAKLVEETNGEVDYLKNTLYPEVGTANCPVKLTSTENAETWGVDDGLGYDTGSYYSNGKKRVYTFIPYYHHYGIWYSSGANHSAEVLNAITSLSDAYLYTGDAKYGRAGAIMLDRMADVYPEFCTTEWIAKGYYLGSSKNGKMLNNIWQSINDLALSKTYDSFFPIYDDPQVVSFLNEKAQKYTAIGDKSTAEAIRTNIETDYLSEMYTAALEADLRGNFGHHQSAIASAAIILDTQPMTNRMIDWIFKESIEVQYISNSGGGVGQQLINEVSRDGQGTESAPGYNRIWVTQLYDVAEVLSMCNYEGMDIWGNPKYIGMLKSYNPMTLVRRGQPSIGDSGRTGWFAQLPDDQNVIIGAFNGVKKYHYESAIELAQLLYRLRMYTEGHLDGMHYDIFTKNPESLKQEILDIIEEYGEYDYDKSSMMTGYGLGVLRAGTLHEDSGTSAIRDTTRDFWMYFGGATSHSHYDKLNLGIEAYGLAMTPENGYPEQTGYHPNRHQWTNTTIAHNTVVVDEKNQYQSAEPLDPLHFDAKDTRVKVMDIDGSSVYTQTEEYRRTVVMIDYDSEISYGVDFFKILGGDDHLYSFHASSEDVHSSSPELEFEQQIGGTYAGVDVPFGNDPYTDPSTNYKKLKYPDGYTWLEDVRRSQNPNLKNFFIDYDIIDLHNYARNPKSAMDINLRVTMANDFEADEVTLAIGYPPRNDANLAYAKHQQYMLVRRTGKDLNTLFTTVYEPYNKNRYISNIERIDMEVKEGTPKTTDKAAALKVELVDGRVDYIVYAQNGDITYTVTDGDMSFDFKGFVGVWTVNAEGDNIYSYLHDGEILSEITDARTTVNGTITDFTHELAFENFVEVSFDEKFDDAEALTGALFRADSPAAGNAAYVIENAVIAEDGMSATLGIGYPTFIDSYIDNSDINGGYNYDIAEGQTFSIALTYEDRHEPTFTSVPEELSTTAGSSVKAKLTAVADDDSEITYSARTLPRGASFDPETATFSWTPTASQIGDNLVAIDAIDTSGRRTTAYFTVKVYGSTTGGGGGGAPTPKPEDKPTEKPEEEKPTTPTTPTVPETPSTDTEDVRFIDLGNHAWAADAINALADDGIIKGTSENTFSPASNITRADFAILLVRAFALKSDNTENFSDVLDTDYFAKELAVARNTGIVNGIGNNKYAPRNTITRQDMMTIVYRALTALEVELTTGDVSTADFESVADYAKDAVKSLVSSGLVNGKNGLIAPTDYTTRAEVAVLIKRILDYKSK